MAKVRLECLKSIAEEQGWTAAQIAHRIKNDKPPREGRIGSPRLWRKVVREVFPAGLPDYRQLVMFK